MEIMGRWIEHASLEQLEQLMFGLLLSEQFSLYTTTLSQGT